MNCVLGDRVKKFLGLLSVVLLASCASMDQRFANVEDRAHPGVKVFLDYQSAVKKSQQFDETLHGYFSPSMRPRFKDMIGWHKLVYTASFRALRLGDCESIYITEDFPDRILVNCEGPYLYESPFGYSREESMHLRVYIVRISEGEWVIGRSGLTHTMDGGESVSRSTGLKFRK